MAGSRRQDRAPLQPGAVPLYEQIKRHVVRLIEGGALAPGDRLPSENELAEHFGVARLTSHRALRELAQEGRIRRVHGLGTFVPPARDTTPAARIYNIAEEVRSSGKAFSAALHRLEAVAADGALAQEMGVAAGTRLFRSLIVYNADGVPVQLEDRVVLPDFAPDYLGQDFASRSTTDYLQAIAPADEAEQVIEASMPDGEIRRLLKMQKDEACLTVIRRTWVDGAVTTYTRFVHPGARRRLLSHIPGAGGDQPSERMSLRLVEGKKMRA